MYLIFYVTLFHIVEWIIFIYLLTSISYLLIFLWAAHMKQKKDKHPLSSKLHRFVVFIPAYKEDAVIEDTISHFIRQEYPSELYDIVVISDQIKQTTLSRLKKYPIIINEVQFKNSTKAKSLHSALSKINKQYDIAVILDADNIVDSIFLEKINNAYSAGVIALQTHRIAQFPKTNLAILDAVSEEINNTIFRQGHVRIGLSSALIGSGMAFDFKLFKECIETIDKNHVGEDKQLEIILLRKRIFIEYLEDVYTYDKKINKANDFYQQRRRWLSTQLSSLIISSKEFFNAVKIKNWNYCDKILQWGMPSRVMLLGITLLLTIIICCYDFWIGIKWISLTILLMGILIASIPLHLRNLKLCKAIIIVPVLFLLMFINHFRLLDAGKKFIHTNHVSDE